MLKIEWSGKSHDQEIMDWLESEINEDAVIAYGEAIPDHMYWDDMEPIKNKLNTVLEELGSSLQLLECVGVDDDGYTWRVRDSGQH